MLSCGSGAWEVPLTVAARTFSAIVVRSLNLFVESRLCYPVSISGLQVHVMIYRLNTTS